MMTTEELINKINTHIGAEIKDCEEYQELARECRNHNMFDVAGVLEDICHDEKSHLDHLIAISTHF